MQILAIAQLVTVMLCASAAFGVLLSTMLVRGRLHEIGAEGPLHDLAFSEKAYVAASTLCAIGALAAVNVNWGSFAILLLAAGAFMIADHALVPRMRSAIAEGRAVPHTVARARFELLVAACLFVVFWKTAAPPLIILARVYGIG
ncbi:MAG: hypothetical protein ACRCTI_17730 [Beijerinckiaceae bacterium]